MKNLCKKIGEFLLGVLVTPIVLLLVICFVVMLPFDFIKYKRSHFYKIEQKKYRPFAASGDHFELYNEIIENSLPIKYISDPEDAGVASGWFVFDDLLIILNYFSFEYDEENGNWNYCCEDEEEKRIIMPLDEYIQNEIDSINEKSERVVCTDAVVLINADSIENADKAKNEPHFLIYESVKRVEVLKKFCGLKLD